MNPPQQALQAISEHAYSEVQNAGFCEVRVDHAMVQLGGAPTHSQIISGFNFITNAYDISGITAAVISVDHRHACNVQGHIAVTAARIIGEELLGYYNACLPTPTSPDHAIRGASPVYKHSDLICELFSVYMVCRFRCSWSVLEMRGSNAVLLNGMRTEAQVDCARNWASAILKETDLINTSPELFMKMCISGAVGCLAYYRAKASPEDSFWGQCEGLFQHRAALDTPPHGSRSCTQFGEMAKSPVPPV